MSPLRTVPDALRANSKLPPPASQEFVATVPSAGKVWKIHPGARYATVVCTNQKWGSRTVYRGESFALVLPCCVWMKSVSLFLSFVDSSSFFFILLLPFVTLPPCTAYPAATHVSLENHRVPIVLLGCLLMASILRRARIVPKVVQLRTMVAVLLALRALPVRSKP